MGIDAPEKKQKCKQIWLSISFISFEKEYLCGEISTDKLKNLIDGKDIICKYTNKDIYKRFIAECFKDKTNINYTKKSFIYNILFSLRQKIDDPLGKKRIKN